MYMQFQYSNFILFLLTQVFCLMSHSEVYLPPPSLSCYLVNPLIPNTALPFPHTRSRFNPWSPGGAAHVWVVIWRSSPSDFPYKQPQIVMSSVVPVESWRSTSNTSSSQGCSHCTFSCITQSK